jgi:alpha-glucosidase (family GH31 glycosyl hydrolase)
LADHLNTIRILSRLVERIRNSGRRAGIWVAPFLVGAESATAAEHPEWLVRTETGAPVLAVRNWDQDTYSLDLTHPGVQDYLTAVFGSFIELGIDFFKIDFVSAATLDGLRYDRSLTSSQVYRQGVNDPDCLLLRPDVEHRQRRVRMVKEHGGLRGVSDRVGSLDDSALKLATELLASVPPPTPFR